MILYQDTGYDQVAIKDKKKSSWLQTNSECSISEVMKGP